MIQCAICYDDISNEKTCVKTPCGHCFHNECLTHWLLTKDNCPICRFQFGETNEEEDDYDEDFSDEPYIVDIFSNLVNCNLSDKNLSYHVRNTICDIIDDIENNQDEITNEDNIWVEAGNIKFTEVEIKTKQQKINIYVEFNDEFKIVSIEMLNKTYNPINKTIRNKNIRTQNWRFKKNNQRQFSRKIRKLNF